MARMGGGSPEQRGEFGTRFVLVGQHYEEFFFRSGTFELRGRFLVNLESSS